MKNIPILSLFILALSIPLAIPATAQEKIDVMVTKPGDTISIQVSTLDGAKGAEATKMLKSDLERSGWFTLVESSSGHIIRGSATASSVEIHLTRPGGSPAEPVKASGNFNRSVHSVADQIVEKLTGHKGIAQTRIAFISDKSGKKELYTMDYDGANVLRFTTDASLVCSPSFNRQTTRVAYTSYKSGFPDVYLMNFPAGSRQIISRYPGLNSGASFSPDGSRIALTLSKDGNPELYTMASSGGGPRRLTKTRGGESSPCWSPDGREIVYSSDQGGRPQLFIVPSSGGEARRITSGGYNTEPDWSMEADLIAYNSMRGNDFAICTIKPDGSDNNTLYDNGSCEDPSWAPDGRHIVFSRTDGRHSDLYVLDIITRQAVQLSKNFGNCTQPSWSGK